MLRTSSLGKERTHESDGEGDVPVFELYHFALQKSHNGSGNFGIVPILFVEPIKLPLQYPAAERGLVLRKNPLCVLLISLHDYFETSDTIEKSIRNH